MMKASVFVWILLCGNALYGISAENDVSLPGNLIHGDIMVKKHEDLWDRPYGPLVDMRQNRWPAGVIPYDLNDTNYSAYDAYVINESMREIERGTCVQFVRRLREKNYIYITPMGGCWSYVGLRGEGAQELSLTSPACMSQGTVIHELLHALGFWHEHSRSDRDRYIQVLWDNVMDKEKQMNFAKTLPEAWNFQEFPYDYQSVMHYDAYAFSKSPKLPTLKPTDRKVRLRDLGRAKAIGTLTEVDRKKINALYECKNKISVFE